jgi:iron(III) transport system substrate-binding protein
MRTCLKLLFLISLFLAGNASAQSDHKSKLVEGAKKEGKVVWYTSMAIDTSKPLLDAFVREYPFIKPDLVRAGEEQLVNRILNETRAGKWLFDVISTSAISTLVDRQFLAPYPSPEREAFISEFKDTQGFWTAVYVNNMIVAYNTKLLPAGDAPKDYRDLLDPKWKGKILMDATDYDWYGTLATAWGRDKAVQYMQALARQDLRWYRGHALLAQLVVAGERPLGWAYSFRIERMKKDGAPVDWVETFDPTVTTINGLGLGARAANPNAGKLLIDFALSKKGQEMVRDMQRIPGRSDVKPGAPKMDQTKLKVKIVPKEVYNHLDQNALEFRKIFGL